MFMERALRSLVADADPNHAELLRQQLEAWGHEVRVAPDARTATVLARVWRPDIVLLELVLPDEDGLSLVPRLREVPEPPQVVIVSGRATVRATVDALAAGAASVIEKPLDVELLQDVLARLPCRRVQSDATADEPVAELGALVTRDRRMKAMFDTLRLAAPSGVNILVQGESGTGKELVAARIHDLSARAGGPFVAVNCAAIPAGLLESELFGHERGAFTGADRRRSAGCFELADGGTLFLDEIGELPLGAAGQAAARAAGARGPAASAARSAISVDVRVDRARPTATSSRAVADGRLPRGPLLPAQRRSRSRVPPLRERAERHRRCSRSTSCARFAPSRRHAGRRLRRRRRCDAARGVRLAGQRPRARERRRARRRSWRRRALVEAGDLPAALRRAPQRAAGEMSVPAGCSLEEVERLAILQTLELTDWNKRQAAKILGIHRPTLYNKLRKYRLWRQEDRFRRDTDLPLTESSSC